MANIINLSQEAEVQMHDDWFDYAGKDHFWFQWRFLYLTLLIKDLRILKSDSKVLDIGGGRADLAKMLEDKFLCKVDLADLNMKTLSSGLEIQGQKFLYNIYDRNESMKEKYDCVFLLDVIEHVEDPKSFIEASAFHLKKGGALIINVPALEMFYSKYDKVVGHLRRYDNTSMQRDVAGSSLVKITSIYWGLFLVPILLIRKIYLMFLSDEKKIIEKGFAPPNNLINTLFGIMGRVEHFLLTKIQPFGSSMMVIYKKE